MANLNAKIWTQDLLIRSSDATNPWSWC
jgi:hypothetical protein